MSPRDSRRHGRGKVKESRGVATQWSEWAWDEPYSRWVCYRKDAHGEYEYQYQADETTKTNFDAQSSSSYSARSVPVPQISVEDLNEQYPREDLNEQYQRLDLADTPRDYESRSRKKSEENRGGKPREPTVSPSREPKPGPPKPPFPIPQNPPPQNPPPQNPRPQNTYDSSGAPYYATSPTLLTPSPYSNISTEQYDVARGEEYDDRFQEPNSSPDYRPNESLVTIRKKSFMATISSSRDSFISSETVDILKLETKKVKAGKYTNPDSGKEYDIRESVKVSIELTGGEKLRDVQLYVITRRCPMKNPVVLGTGVLGTTEPASPDYPSPRSIDSGYGTASMPSGYGAASSRHPSVNQPLRPLAATFTSTSGSATYPVGQPSYSSAPSVPHRPLYTQTMSNVQETSSSSYPNSSYPAVRTMSHGTSSSYYPQGDGRHGSHHETYAPSTSSHDRKQDSRSSSYDAKGHSEGGMEYNSPHDGDHYSLHSGSHSSYITPRPTSFSDEPQNVYSSASDDTVYADYVAH